MNSLLQKEIKKLKATEINACDVLNSNEKTIVQNAVQDTEQTVNELLSQNKNFASAIKDFNDFKLALENLDIKSLALACTSHEITNQEECFTNSLNKAFAEISRCV